MLKMELVCTISLIKIIMEFKIFSDKVKDYFMSFIPLVCFMCNTSMESQCIQFALKTASFGRFSLVIFQ